MNTSSPRDLSHCKSWNRKPSLWFCDQYKGNTLKKPYMKSNPTPQQPSGPEDPVPALHDHHKAQVD